MKNIFMLSIFLLLITYLALPLSTYGEDENVQKQAVLAAENWLKMVDNGDYAKSWDDASILFKRAISKEDWIKTIKGVRPPLGKVESRKLESATFATQLPGAPDGDYLVIQFKTVFQNKSNAVETITPMKEGDGTWKVSGYYIK